MRFSYVASLCLTLAFIPAMAQSEVQSEGKKTFGIYTCDREPVPCYTYGAYTSDQWAKAGQECAIQAFSFRAKTEGPLFDNTAGLDSSNCLTTNINALTKNGATRLIPYCCVKQLPTQICAFECRLVEE